MGGGMVGPQAVRLPLSMGPVHVDGVRHDLPMALARMPDAGQPHRLKRPSLTPC